MSSSSVIIGKSLADTFHQRIARNPLKAAMLRKVQGQWSPVTWRDYEIQAFRIGSALVNEGIKRGDRVAILSNSRPEWSFADLGTLCVGAVTIPVYPSITADDIHYILKDSGASLLFVEDANQAKKIAEILPSLSGLKRVVSFDSKQSKEGNFVSLESWLAETPGLAEKPSDAQLSEWRLLGSTLQGGDLASIVYTSGTSGVPKGALLSHGNFLAFNEGAIQVLGMTEQDTTLLFLPLAHILGRCEQMLALGCGWTNAYAESLKSMMDNLTEVRPTVLVCVPRIYEKIYASVLGKLSTGPRVMRLLADRLVGFSSDYSKLLEGGKRLDPVQWFQHQAFDRLIYSKIRDRFGGRVRFCISGGAPFSPEISRFFHASGILVLEGYGLTETTGPVTVNHPKSFRIGSVGPVLPSDELRIADDGEILVKGRTVFSGYNGGVSPEALVDGWFATGDIGMVDAQGFLKITDRKKDLIVTAGGKNIAPQKLEGLILEDPLFSQAIVIGDKRKFLSALVCLNAGEAKKLASDGAVGYDSLAGLYETEVFQALVQKRIDRVNKKLPSYETVKRLRILPRELSVEAGELTPSLKIKRKFCTDKYSELIEQMYN